MIDSGIKVFKVFLSSSYTIVKFEKDSISIIKNLGVKGDIHSGKRVKHRYLADKNPNAPNLRQVHLIQKRTYDLLMIKFPNLKFGELGENVITVGVEYDNLFENSILSIGKVRLKVTGLRYPCILLDQVHEGLFELMKNLKNEKSIPIPVGIMTVVEEGGIISKDDTIQIYHPTEKNRLIEV